MHVYFFSTLAFKSLKRLVRKDKYDFNILKPMNDEPAPEFTPGAPREFRFHRDVQYYFHPVKHADK